MRIRVEIDQLVLYGFNNKKHDADQIDQHIENELARLFIAKDGDVENSKVIKSGDGKKIINRIDGGSFNLLSDHNISKLAGANIAKSIHRAIGTTQSASTISLDGAR